MFILGLLPTGTGLVRVITASSKIDSLLENRQSVLETLLHDYIKSVHSLKFFLVRYSVNCFQHAFKLRAFHNKLTVTSLPLVILEKNIVLFNERSRGLPVGLILGNNPSKPQVSLLDGLTSAKLGYLGGEETSVQKIQVKH